MRKVLICDDNKSIRSMLSTCLELMDYEVLTAEDAYIALEIFKKHKIEIAFIDIKMPKMSGTQLLKKIRKEKYKTTVIIMTAFATVKNAVECTKMGAVGYIRKPFTPERIKKILKEIDKEVLKVEEKNNITKNSIHNTEKYLNNNEMEKAVKEIKYVLSEEFDNSEIYKMISKYYLKKGEEEKSNLFNRVSCELKKINDKDLE